MIICVNCGGTFELKNSEGSYKHPYCKECFRKVWKNDYKKYAEFLSKHKDG